MSKTTAARSVSSFSDLSELFAKETMTSRFNASFGDPIPLSIVDENEALEGQDMPDPVAMQADCAGIIATIFDLLTDTQLDPLSPQLAWGMVNSFHFAAGVIEREEDKLADQIRVMVREMKPGEVDDNNLEKLQDRCQMLAAQRETLEAMRDYAGAAYRTYAGRPWSPARGSRASKVTTASQISALDFLRARSERRRDRYDPQGPVVVISGPADWHDWRIVWGRLDQIRARIPNMVLVTTGQRLGVDAAAAAWAAQRGVVCIAFGLYGRGKGKGFKRNRDIAELMPVEAILCEGSGIQSSLYDLFNPQQGHRVPTHVFMRADQEPAVPIKKKRRVIAA